MGAATHTRNLNPRALSVDTETLVASTVRERIWGYLTIQFGAGRRGGVAARSVSSGQLVVQDLHGTYLLGRRRGDHLRQLLHLRVRARPKRLGPSHERPLCLGNLVSVAMAEYSIYDLLGLLICSNAP